MAYIRNREELLSHGDVEARRVALDIVEHALDKANPYSAAKSHISLSGNILTAGDVRIDLSKRGKIYVLGAGKASFPIVKALEEVLGDRIADGVLICKYGQEGQLQRVRLRFANHPVPDEAGFRATQEAVELARKTQAGDVVFCAITGGSSALMTMPVESVSLEEKKLVNRLLLRSGANIFEINSVRKHLSQVKGGRLASMIHPHACIINFTVSDVIGDDLDYITCPTVPDTSTFADAHSVMTKYDLWNQVPESVRKHLQAAAAKDESPKAKDLADHDIHSYILVPGTGAVEAAYKKAQEMGLSTMVLSTMLQGESREVGGTYADIAREILATGRPLKVPCAIIGGGETTVRITGQPGDGGPNQEFTVGAALLIDGIGKVAVLGLDSDGTDGPTDLAGGICDELSVKRAASVGVDLFASLETHNVSPALRKLGDSVFTGATGTNVNDLKILVVLSGH
ncbi:MAG TPA: glycerate kinase [Firmicutes bacterium]|jgi:glycerate-2-kinase|nr:glycerate kinase [Bacillota bacterium]HCF93208.1 glycerate kinase [Bacillota bacterium]